MGVAVGDLDRDLVPDLAVTNLAGQGHRLFTSEPADVGWFSAQSPLTELGDVETGWGIAIVDLDSDGASDAIVASGEIPMTSLTDPRPVSVFRGEWSQDSSTGGSLLFELWTFDAETPPLPALNGRGMAPADYDYDYDGDIDVAVSSTGGALVLLENRFPQGRALNLDLGLAPTGTVVHIGLSDGRTLRHQVTSGGLWMSSDDPRIHVGLEPDVVVESLEVELLGGGREPLPIPAAAASSG